MNKILLGITGLISAALVLWMRISTTDLGEGLVNEADAVLLKNANNQYNHWNGIGKIHWDDEARCTGSLLDTRNMNNVATGPAYLLTSAHCIKGAIYYPKEFTVESVKFNYFNDTTNNHKTYMTHKTVWMDYKHTDLAIIELAAPLSQLIDDGITPLEFAAEVPTGPGDVLIVGAPQLAETGLRLAACSQEPTEATIVEKNLEYPDSLKNRCQDIRPGSSGSPVLDRQNGKILSVVGTSTYGASIDNACFWNAPCEVKNGKISWSPDTHYTLPATFLASCFNNGVFNAEAAACKTHKTFEVTDLPRTPTEYLVMPLNATDPEPAIEANFSLNTPHYRFKIVRDDLQCQSPEHYSNIFSATNATIKAPLTQELGMHFLCIVGVESAEQTLSEELMKSVWTHSTQLAEATPVRMPEPTTSIIEDKYYGIAWQKSPPFHDGTIAYPFRGANTNCNDVDAEKYINADNGLRFLLEHLPVTVCSKNRDASNRYSAPRTDVLQLP